MLTFKRPSEESIYNTYDPQGSKLLNRLSLGFSYLREYKFRHNFVDTGNLLCSCALENESTIGHESTDHFILRFQNYVPLHTAFMNKFKYY